MKLIEITITTTTDASELVADILSDLGSKGIGIYDSQDFEDIVNGHEVLWDYADESLYTSDGVARINGYFQPDELDEKVACLGERLKFLKENSPFDCGELATTNKEIDDEDWINSWRAQYKPISAGAITIVPQWIDYTAKADEIVVKIEPGRAFGTGSHETTYMCLGLMQQCGVAGKVVADIGAGSGILGISMAKLGAKSVEAFDIDADAVKVAQGNILLNGVQDIMTVECGDMLAKANGKYQVIVANITADVLIAMSNEIGNHLVEGGFLILSGIISMRENEVLNAYLSKNFGVRERKTVGDWVAFLLRNKAVQ